MQKQPLFHKPISELIRQRHSCRTFAVGGIEAEMRREIRDFFPLLRPPFSGYVRLDIVDKEKVKAENFFTSGTYGMIKGARYFMAGIIPKSEERAWENFGFVMEAAILKAADLGLETCWIGGVFDRKRFGRELGIGASELLPAVVAVGHAASGRTFRDRFVRWSARGDRRKPFAELFFGQTPGRPVQNGQEVRFGGILENVRLAPSASNKQPWRVFLEKNRFHFYLDRDRAYARLMPGVDLQRIDMGIAMCHFELSCFEAGIGGKWEVSPPEIAGMPENFAYIVSFRLD
jgi:nitroreductase